MGSVRENVFGLFGEHERIADNECFDYRAHAFYEELERSVANHGTDALDAIEECIFHQDFKRFDSVYRAVYFCGYSGQEHLEKKTSILKRVLESHPDWIVRHEAVDALHDMKQHDMIKDAYAKESNENVKKAMTRWLCKAAIRGEFRNIHIGLLLDAFLEYDRNVLLSNLKNKNTTPEKDIREYLATSLYPQNISGVKLAFLSEDNKKLVAALVE
jgi:hypothetical protein